MHEEYRVSSSEKLQQMEAELSHQLSALRAEIEENGFQRGADSSRCYSSVLCPKEISFYRVEREQALRRGLQVAEVLPAQSPADIMQRELQSCLSLEYTPESLPALLHQFFTDRSHHLAQIKYLLMLRWRRFCRHSSVIEKLYPHYKDQVLYLTAEYEDAIQRARRLSASRDKILTGRGDVTDMITQEDLIIYLRWLVCHLHSIKSIHNFLRVLHYIPACEREDKEASSGEETQHADRLAVPLNTVHLEEFLPELQTLLDYFQLSFDTRDLRSTADQMELLTKVWREFRDAFRQQEEMKTFPQYESSEVKLSQWGRKSPSQALKKEATWIPFIQVKPKRDPWQQKCLMKLKENKSVDELLKMHSRFLQVPDIFCVVADLRLHATHVDKEQPASTSSTSRCSNTKRHKISEIWTSVYSAAALAQENHDQSPGSAERGGPAEESLRRHNSGALDKSYSLEERFGLLGLNDTLGGKVADSISTEGAYLSLIYLRHLKLRHLQRVSLGLLNYLRSVERTLTFDLAGLQQQEGELCSTAEETRWMNAARGGGGGAVGGLSSLQFIHNCPLDFKVRCSEFKEFAEVENLHDFYSSEERLIHTQDQRGFYIVYDAALKDLEQLENELLLMGSHFIHRYGIKETGIVGRGDMQTPVGTEVDRVSVLLDLWTWETKFLESKVQLLNCYYEAYQHTAGSEERFALAQVITDIMHSRPHVDLEQDYFIQVYRAEIDCLRIHQQLIREILEDQIDKQRQYLHRIWRDDHKSSFHFHGFPHNYIPKHPVSLGGSSPALMNVFLLEIHPSLSLVSSVYQCLAQANSETCELHGATSSPDKLILRQKLLLKALQSWRTLPAPGTSYSAQIQKDLFSEVFFEDLILVQNVGLSLVRSAEERDLMQGREKQMCALETFTKLLELVTIRHRLLEAASETAHLAQLYRNVASELGFDEFHLYLRPVQFEVAEQKPKKEQRPIFITATLEGNSCVDRFSPAQLPLSVHELDENQIGRFSFSSEESVSHLMNKESLENLQVSLACQLAQRNALISAVKLVRVCQQAERVSSSTWQSNISAPSYKGVKFDSKPQSNNSSSSKSSNRSPSTAQQRLSEAFVSIQLEKVGLRDEMLNSFLEKRRAMGALIKTPEEAAKIKRRLIIDFLNKFSSQMSQYCVRAQIIKYYCSLTSLLEDIPSIRKSHFMIGQPRDPSVDSGGDLCPDPRSSESRPQQLLSADGKTLLNLWFVPHFSEVLHMFKTLNVTARDAALDHTLQIASAIHDILYYLVTFSRLGNANNSWSCWRREEAPGSSAAAWGGSEGIGAELQELQLQVDRLCDPSSPESVGRLLQLRRSVALLQFDATVRVLIRNVFLSSGDFASYQSVSDNMAAALPLLSDSCQCDVFSLTLPVPPPLEKNSAQAQRIYPWRSFLSSHGLFPLCVWDVPPVELCMQLCLSGLSDRSRLKANAATLGVSLLMEDVLNSGREVGPVHLHGNKDDLLHRNEVHEVEKLSEEEEKSCVPDSSAALLQDPIRMQSVLRGFLLLMKQLQGLKESWARARLGFKVFTTPSLYQQFVKLYRTEIFLPSMKALAHHMGKERDYEVLLSGTQCLLIPPGASEVDVKTWQLQKLLENSESDMIRALQRKINADMMMVLSERTRQDGNLPTELWKKPNMKHCLSLETPQIVETFIQQLMEGAEEVEEKLMISQDHLRRCVSHLGCSVVERERRSFLVHSQFYEEILIQQTQLLHHREQDLKHLKNLQSNNTHKEVPAVCRGLMLEMSAIQARVAQLLQEKKTQEEIISLQFKERYEPLIRHLGSTCIQLRGRLEDQRLKMQQDVSEMINRVRVKGMERLILLKGRYGCTEDNGGLKLTQLKREEVHELQQENRRLTALLCKMKTLSGWRKLIDQEKLHRQLLLTQQREISSRSEALRVKMRAEEEVFLLQEELQAAVKELTRCQAECCSAKTLLHRKTQELSAARHQTAQEAQSRKELDRNRVQSLEQMRTDVEDRERRLRALSEQLDRGSRMSELQRQQSAKAIRQVKGRLQQERGFKQEAFQCVDRLQSQVSDMEAALSRCSSNTAQRRSYYTLSVNRLSSRSPSAALPRVAQQAVPQPGSSTYGAALQELASESGQQRAETAGRRERPKADPTRLPVLVAETFPGL